MATSVVVTVVHRVQWAQEIKNTNTKLDLVPYWLANPFSKN